VTMGDIPSAGKKLELVIKMQDFTFEAADPFHISRMHGMNGFEALKDAHDVLISYQGVLSTLANETPEQMFANAAATLSKKRHHEEIAFKLISRSVILYQASMEACLYSAMSQNASVNEAAKRGSSFRRRWELALDAVGASKLEFEEYVSGFYEPLRIPLTHLEQEGRVEQVRKITFRAAYGGFRNGWWAYVRLLHGIGLSGDNCSASWKYICSGVDLDAALYPEDAPAG